MSIFAGIGGCEGGWDTHGFNDKPMYPILKKYLLPITNQTLPTLLEDLDQRGLLDTTSLSGSANSALAEDQ